MIYAFECAALTSALRSGIFIVLFLIAMDLLHRRAAPGHRALVILTVAMALLATTQFSLHVVSASLALRLLQAEVQDGPRFLTALPTPTENLYWVLVLTQDAVLVTNTSVHPTFRQIEKNDRHLFSSSVITDGLFVRLIRSKFRTQLCN